MRDDQILEMAKQEWSAGEVYIGPDIRSLTRFARLIEAATREEDAVIAELEADDAKYNGVEGACLRIAAAIRNSGGAA